MPLSGAAGAGGGESVPLPPGDPARASCSARASRLRGPLRSPRTALLVAAGTVPFSDHFPVLDRGRDVARIDAAIVGQAVVDVIADALVRTGVVVRAVAADPGPRRRRGDHLRTSGDLVARFLEEAAALWSALRSRSSPVAARAVVIGDRRLAMRGARRACDRSRRSSRAVSAAWLGRVRSRLWSSLPVEPS